VQFHGGTLDPAPRQWVRKRVRPRGTGGAAADLQPRPGLYDRGLLRPDDPDITIFDPTTVKPLPNSSCAARPAAGAGSRRRASTPPLSTADAMKEGEHTGSLRRAAQLTLSGRPQITRSRRENPPRLSAERFSSAASLFGLAAVAASLLPSGSRT
jgi:hypothetical protein